MSPSVSESLPRVARRLLPVAIAALLAALPAMADAQEGHLAGTVVNEDTGEPLTGAQVTIAAAGLGAVTNNVGGYLLRNVPAGQQTVRVTLIGYAPAERTVTVRAGETLQADFTLRPRALEMEQIVVTGTAGATRKRELGNTMSQIDASDLALSAITEMSDALQGRASGLTVVENSGMVGTGSSIRLRGNNSISFGNEPLIYVDGVRVRGAAYTGDAEINQAASPLDDLNPADIERIEIVKGAAATTLYGTEAAGGVIQIFTKRGAAGAPAWTFGIEQGVNTMPWVGPDESVNPHGLYLFDCTGAHTPDDPADDDPSCPASGSWFKNGHLQTYNLSVRGGAEKIDYFLSGRFGSNGGVIAPPRCLPPGPAFDPAAGCEAWEGDDNPSRSMDYAIRGNFGFSPLDNLTIQFNNSYSHREIGWIPDGDNAEGFLLNVIRGTRGYTTNDVDGLALTMDLDQDIEHLTSGVNFLWTPRPGLDQRLRLGLDYNHTDLRQEEPWGFWYGAEGHRDVYQLNNRMLTFDYTGSWRTAIGEALSSSFSWGGQIYDDFRWGTNPWSYAFAGPGDKVLQSGAEQHVLEVREKLTSGGFFFQEQVGWRDLLFLTAGVRFDGFSTFGEGAGLATYPKAQAAFLISDLDFWPAWWSTMKLRAALGESGKAPGAFDAKRLWESVSADENQPGVIIRNLGNPDLGPEITREVEAGFDASFLDDRVSAEVTWYNQRTYDGIVGVLPAPSLGVVEETLMNVGEFENRGVELSLNVDAVRSSNVLWTLGGRYSTNDNMIHDLGGLEDIYVGWRQHLRPCQETDNPDTRWNETTDCPIPGYWHSVVVNPNEVGVKPIFEEDYLGPSWPTHLYGLNTTLTLFDRVTFDILGEGQGGHVLSSGVAYQNVRRREWPPCFEIQDQIDANRAAGRERWDGLRALDVGRCDPVFVTYGMWVEPADFFKIRSASVSFRFPENWLPRGTRGLVVRLAGRNLATFTDYPGLDPETYEDGARDFANLFRQEYYNLPPMRTFIVSATVNF